MLFSFLTLYEFKLVSAPLSLLSDVRITNMGNMGPDREYQSQQDNTPRSMVLFGIYIFLCITAACDKGPGCEYRLQQHNKQMILLL